MVSLFNEHRSGGWQWTAQEEEKYNNDFSFDGHPIAVTASANRSKRPKGPEEWRSLDAGYWCEYAASWITVKSNWKLTAIHDEWEALVDMLGTCSVEVLIEAGGAPPTATPTPIATATPMPSASPSQVFLPPGSRHIRCGGRACYRHSPATTWSCSC